MTEWLAVRRLKDSEGSTLVEFGLVLLMLLIVIFGVVEMARLVLVYTTDRQLGARRRTLCDCSWRRSHLRRQRQRQRRQCQDRSEELRERGHAPACRFQYYGDIFALKHSGLNGHRKSRVYVQSDAVLFRQFVKRASWKYKSGSNYVLRAL